MKRRDLITNAGVVGGLGMAVISGCLNASDPESDESSGNGDGETGNGDDTTNQTTDEGSSDNDTDSDSDPDPDSDSGGPEWHHPVGGSVQTVAHGSVLGHEDFSDEDGDGGVFALDIETGDHEWTYGETGGYTMYTSLTVADALYFGFGTDAIGDGSGKLHVLEYDGTERWTRDVGSVYSRPIVDGDGDGNGDVVYAGSDDGVVRALDTTDGTVRWSTDDFGGEHPSDVSVVAVTDAVLVATGQLVALDPANGSVLWTYGDPDDRIRDATVVDDLAYLTDRDGLVAVADGDERWRVDFEYNRWIKGIEAGRVFVEHQYDIHAFDLEDGDELWTKTNSDRAAVDFHADRAYVGTDQLSALEAAGGSERWSVSVGDDDEPIQSVRIVVDGGEGSDSDTDGDDHSIFVQTGDHRLSRVNPDGEITWTETVDGQIGSVVVEDDFVIVGSREGIYSFSMDSQ